MNKPYDRPLRGRQCQCQTCFEYFNSDYGFDQHRIGPWEARGTRRRCLTVTEMLGQGWSRNAKDFWIKETRQKRQERAGVADSSGSDEISA